MTPLELKRQPILKNNFKVEVEIYSANSGTGLSPSVLQLPLSQTSRLISLCLKSRSLTTFKTTAETCICRMKITR